MGISITKLADKSIVLFSVNPLFSPFTPLHFLIDVPSERFQNELLILEATEMQLLGCLAFVLPVIHVNSKKQLCIGAVPLWLTSRIVLLFRVQQSIIKKIHGVLASALF